MRATSTRRGGFTLVELFVVLGIILVLIGIAVLVANSGLVTNLRTTGGSDRIQGWLMQARSRAQRDAAPRGVRFVADGNGYVREAVLIEVPEPYTPPSDLRLMIEQYGTGTVAPNGPAERRLFVVGTSAAQVRDNVGVGDTLSIPDLGTIHQVQSIQPAAGVHTFRINGVDTPAVEIRVVDQTKIPDLGAAYNPLPNPTPFPAATVSPTAARLNYSTTTFGFHRQARPVYGEPSLPLPEGIAIAINTNNSINPNNAGVPSLSLIPQTQGFYDIVFSPNGEVQNPAGLGRMVLWVGNPDTMSTIDTPNNGGVRSGGDTRPKYESAGEMTFICVYTKTGAVAIQPVKLPPGGTFAVGEGPYDFTKDGIATGL